MPLPTYHTTPPPLPLRVDPLPFINGPLGQHPQFGWVQYVGPTGWQGDASWGANDAQMAFPILIDWNVIRDSQDTLYGLTGYSRVLGTPHTLSRVCPWSCPVFPWMYCTRVASMRGLTYQGKWEHYSNGFSGDDQPWASYRWAMLMCVFQTLPYAVLTDSQIYDSPGSGEWDRFTHQVASSQNFIVNRDRGYYQYAEGPHVGNQVPGFVRTSYTKQKITIWWEQVPKDYVLGSGGLPDNILTLVNKTNNNPFLGHPTGTLLMQEPTIEPVMMFASPLAMGFIDLTQPPRAYRIGLNMIRFDPPAFNPANRGHNLLPYPGEQQWYLVESVDGAEDLFPEAPFENAFAAV